MLGTADLHDKTWWAPRQSVLADATWRQQTPKPLDPLRDFDPEEATGFSAHGKDFGSSLWRFADDDRELCVRSAVVYSETKVVQRLDQRRAPARQCGPTSPGKYETRDWAQLHQLQACGPERPEKSVRTGGGGVCAWAVSQWNASLGSSTSRRRSSRVPRTAARDSSNTQAVDVWREIKLTAARRMISPAASSRFGLRRQCFGSKDFSTRDVTRR